MEAKTIKRLLNTMRPRTVMGFVSIAALLIAAIRLMMVQNFPFYGFLVFLIPPLFAMMCQNTSRLSTRWLAVVFLVLVDLAVAIAPVSWLFPNLRSMKEGLSRTDARLLTLYLTVYLLYIFAIMPPIIFGRGLIRRQRDPEDFSTFTNVLGIFAWLLVGPLMVWFMMTTMGMWPIIRG